MRTAECPGQPWICCRNVGRKLAVVSVIGLDIERHNVEKELPVTSAAIATSNRAID